MYLINCYNCNLIILNYINSNNLLIMKHNILLDLTTNLLAKLIIEDEALIDKSNNCLYNKVKCKQCCSYLGKKYITYNSNNVFYNNKKILFPKNFVIVSNMNALQEYFNNIHNLLELLSQKLNKLQKRNNYLTNLINCVVTKYIIICSKINFEDIKIN